MAKRTGGKRTSKSTKPKQAKSYGHPTSNHPMRSEVGTQSQFKKKKPPKIYRYNSSLSPELNWDGQNPARELGEWLLARIDEAAALDAPHVFPDPQEFRAADGSLLTTVRDLRDAVQQLRALGKPFLKLPSLPDRSIADQVLNCYEYRDNWVNRMILRDSLVVMNSPLEQVVAKVIDDRGNELMVREALGAER